MKLEESSVQRGCDWIRSASQRWGWWCALTIDVPRPSLFRILPSMASRKDNLSVVAEVISQGRHRTGGFRLDCRPELKIAHGLMALLAHWVVWLKGYGLYGAFSEREDLAGISFGGNYLPRPSRGCHVPVSRGCPSGRGTAHVLCTVFTCCPHPFVRPRTRTPYSAPTSTTLSSEARLSVSIGYGCQHWRRG